MPPLISAVMITGMARCREPLARAAVRCFFEQTYPKKELVVINHSTRRLIKKPVHNCREILVNLDSLGALRNLGLGYSRGEFIIAWDDDDWYHPDRIAEQFVYLQETGCSAVVLRRQLRVQLHRFETAFVSAPATGHAGTILHRRTIAQYPALNRSEDSVFLSSHFPDFEVLQNHAYLYIRHYHGANVWSKAHILTKSESSEPPTEDDLKFLNRAWSYYS